MQFMQKEMLQPSQYYYVFEGFSVDSFNAQSDLSFTKEQQWLYDFQENFERQVREHQEESQKQSEKEYQEAKETYQRQQREKEQQKEDEKKRF